ncbi:MAG: ATP-binding protein [Granulosicoccus sp.]
MTNVINTDSVLDALMTGNPEPCYVKDMALTVVAGNAAYLNFFPSELRSSVIGTQAEPWVKSDEGMIGVENDTMALNSGTSRCIEQRTMPDGRIRIFDMHRVRVEHSSGDSMVLCTGRDVTEREDLIRELQHEDSEWCTFVSRASHDLHEPLRMLGTFTQLLRTQHDNKLDEQSLHLMDVTIQSTQKLKILVDDIRTYARSSEKCVCFTTVDVASVLDRIVNDLRSATPSTNARITWGEMPNLISNPERLSQVLKIIISNSLLYQDSENKASVHVDAHEQDDQWVISISDNGIGIPEKDHEVVFKAFKRLHDRELYPGYGLGLAICRRIVDSLGGRVWLESSMNGRTTFSLSIPKKTR